MSRFQLKEVAYIGGSILLPGEYELPDETPEAAHLVNLDKLAKRAEEAKAKAEKDEAKAKAKAEKEAKAAESN